MKIRINVKKLEKFQGFIYHQYLLEITKKIEPTMLLDLQEVYVSKKLRDLLRAKCRKYIELMLRNVDKEYVEAHIAKNDFEFEPRVDDGLDYGEVKIKEIGWT